MSEKNFFVEKPNSEIEQNYKQKILAIVNDMAERVRLIIPDQVFHQEIHKQEILSNKNETKEHEGIRKDICESFGVPFDAKHVYVFDSEVGESTKKQRAERAFIVLIDTITREGFYGEGRTGHVILLNKLVELGSELYPDMDTETVFDGIESDPPKFITFKGFLSNDGFSSFSEGSKSVLKTPIFDAEGNVIETPEEWFLTGHSLQDHSSPKKS